MFGKMKLTTLCRQTVSHVLRSCCIGHNKMHCTDVTTKIIFDLNVFNLRLNNSGSVVLVTKIPFSCTTTKTLIEFSVFKLRTISSGHVILVISKCIYLYHKYNIYTVFCFQPAPHPLRPCCIDHHNKYFTYTTK